MNAIVYYLIGKVYNYCDEYIPHHLTSLLRSDVFDTPDHYVANLHITSIDLMILPEILRDQKYLLTRRHLDYLTRYWRALPLPH